MDTDTSPEKTCPLCGAANNCAMAQGRPAESCWCQDVAFSQEALSRIPEASRNKHCICQACATLTDELAEPAR
ncbi:MAG: cysteine-rich CWC family protein [Halioglobus sp.]